MSVGAPPRAAATRLLVGALGLGYSASAATLPTRLELPRLLNARGLLGRGAEVGVFRGEFTEHVLAGWAGQEVLAIDPWLAFAGDEYRDTLNSDQVDQDARHAGTLARLRPFGGRASVWRMTGDAAAAQIEDGSLDWIYLDARHDCDSVTNDLQAWWPKIRRGGVMAGHDYIEGRRGVTEFGVKPAVDGFFARVGLPVYSTFLDEPFVSWIVEAPGGHARPRARQLAGLARTVGIAAARVRRTLAA